MFHEKQILEALERIEHALHHIERELSHRHCHHHPHHNHVLAFEIKEITMLPIAPGFSPVYTATPVPSTSVPSTAPVWTSSDTINAPVLADATGLVGTVAIPSTALVGATFTLTVTYTNADGTVATGTLGQTIVAAPSPDITSFTIAQTA